MANQMKINELNELTTAEMLEKEKQFLEEQQPIKYQQYLRAMFDEWNKINPALTEEHERFYNRLLTDYNNN